MTFKMKAGYHSDYEKHRDEKPSLKEQGFYHTTAWRSLRVVALQRDHYLCQNCLRNNRITPATEVHHIQPLEEHPELSLTLSNLQSLCWDCHEQTKKHGKHSVPVPSGVRTIKITDGSTDASL